VPNGSALALGPTIINFAVGDIQPIQALGSTGQSVTGLTWASSDPTIVSLSTDDPPILTALAPGTVTITGGTASANVTVWTPPLPTGTVRWSNLGDGSGVAQIIPAVPSATGLADVFALQNDGVVQALTSDGLTAWTFAVPDAVVSQGQPPWHGVSVMPDFQGGLVVYDSLANSGNGTITKVDGITGQAYPAYSLTEPGAGYAGINFVGLLAVHTDGTIFATEGNSAASINAVTGINPITGTQAFSVPIQIPQPILVPGNCPPSGTTVYSLHAVYSGIVADDGNLYIPYAYDEVVNTCGIVGTHLRLLQVSSSGASNVLTILDAQTPHDLASYQNANLQVGMITNADTGVALTWSLQFAAGEGVSPVQNGMAITNGTAVSLVGPPTIPSPNGGPPAVAGPVLQAEDGSFFGSVRIPTSVAPPTYQNRHGLLRPIR
jgi:hypothetical protein